MTRLLCLFVFLFTFGLLDCVRAAPVTYLFQGEASGDVGGINFADDVFLITAIGDTNNRTAFSNGFTILSDSAQISFASVNGGGPFTISTPTSINVNTQFDTVTFGNETLQFDLVLLGDSSLSGYELIGDIGPITGAGFVSSAATPLSTSGGELTFSSNSEGNVTFTAITSVPEPGVLLPATLCVGTISLRRRRSAGPAS